MGVFYIKIMRFLPEKICETHKLYKENLIAVILKHTAIHHDSLDIVDDIIIRWFLLINIRSLR